MKTKSSTTLRVTTDGGRLDRFLAEKFPAWSRTSLQRMINKRLITVDGHPASPKNALRTGQTIRVEWPVVTAPTKAKSTGPLPFPILFEDKTLIAVNKPPALVVHPAAGHNNGGTLVEILAPLIGGGPWPDEIRPGLVHRLDRDTSGVIVLAKSPAAHAALSKQFALRQVKKTYVALVHGRMERDEGTIESHIGRHPGLRQRFAVSSTRGRWASTRFHVKERFGSEATLVELTPLTGRTHQIRVHLASYGHPIIGDFVYGAKDKEITASRQMLHAHTLAFRHPVTGETVQLTAPIPTDFQDTIKLIRLRA